MRTVNYDAVLVGTAEKCGLDTANISDIDFATLRRSHRTRLATAYEYHEWPELCPVSKRFFRADYAGGTAYTATQEVYYPSTGLYYQALKSTTGNAPATGTPLATNLAYWAVSATSYAAADYAAGTTYAVGDQVSYNGSHYQLHTSAVAGTAPSDTSKWGVLTRFDRYIAYAQSGQTAFDDVLGVYSDNPLLTTRYQDIMWTRSQTGLQILEPATFVWIKFRTRCPDLKGATYSAATAYVTGDQVYYSSSTVAGNFYDAIASTTGNLPTDTSKWTVVEIPKIFDRYLEQAGFADWLRGQKRYEEAAAEGQLAAALLDDQKFLLTGQQGLTERTTVLTR